MHDYLRFLGNFTRKSRCAVSRLRCASAFWVGKVAGKSKHAELNHKMICIMMTGWSRSEKARLLFVAVGVIKTKSSAERKTRIYAKRKAKGKSFCWVANYINMTNGFFRENEWNEWRLLCKLRARTSQPSGSDVCARETMRGQTRRFVALEPINLSSKLNNSGHKSRADLSSFAFSLDYSFGK